MDTVRYVLGVLMVALFPPALLYWLAIHPFASFWRKLGAAKTYWILVPSLVVVALFLYLVRERLLGADLGTQWTLAGIGFTFYLIAAFVGLRVHRSLTYRILVGVPEVSKTASPGKLLHEGIYGVVRHPRYLSIMLGAPGFALVINYTGVYVVMLLVCLVLYIIIVIEERELLDRFGREYREYQKKVPMLIPRLRRKTR